MSVVRELENIVSRLEEELEDARDAGFREGEEHGIKAGEQLVYEMKKNLLDKLDQRRRQAELPIPLHPGVMSLDQVEKMIRKEMEL